MSNLDMATRSKMVKRKVMKRRLMEKKKKDQKKLSWYENIREEENN